MDAAIRKACLRQHPLVRKKYIVPTPSIDEFYERVKESIDYGMSGLMIYGQSRFGKTSAIRYVEKMLSLEFPEVAVFSFLNLKWKGHSESAFFSHLLERAGHVHAHAGTTARKRSRLKHLLRFRAEKAGSQTLVIFVDEAQRMDVIEFEWLRDVYDEIEEFGITVLVFLVGQPHLLNQKNALRQSGQMQIVGRFMTHELAFQGLTCADDVATCLAGYDESCYPERSDWTYTRFFFPRAYAEGFRLVSQARSLWEAFVEAHEAAQFTFEVELPMKYFALAVEIALRKHTAQDAPELRLSPAIWQHAVHESGYVSAQQAVHLGMADDIED